MSNHVFADIAAMCDMHINQVSEYGTYGYRVIRVPGGWIYDLKDTLNGTPGRAAVFVPIPRPERR